jgi:hypothetical protein
MSDFPNTIYAPRETENLPGIVYNPDQKQNLFSEDFQNLGAEINAIEQALGAPCVPNGTVFGISTLYDMTSLQSILQFVNADSNPNINTLQLPNLITLIADFSAVSCDNLTYISTPSISSCRNVNILNNPILQNLYFTALNSCNFFVVINNSNLNIVDISSLLSVQQIHIQNNPNLYGVTLMYGVQCYDISLQNCNLDLSSVDNLLVAVDNNGLSNGQLDLSGGTNAIPTDGELNVNVVSLRLRGWQVYLNS